MLELIAVSAAMKELDFEKPLLLRAFNRFLATVEKIDQLHLAFEKYGQGLWKISQSASCGIIEPSNPYNNLSKNFAKREVELANLKMFAKVTRERISQAMQSQQCSIGLGFFDLFRSQPKLVTAFALLPIPSILGGEDDSYKSFFPRMELRNPNKFKINPMMGQFLKAIQSSLFIYVRAASLSTSSSGGGGGGRGGGTPELSKIRPVVNKRLTEDVRGGSYSPWTSSHGKRHEDYDVTLTVPISDQSKLGAVKYSFKWD